MLVDINNVPIGICRVRRTSFSRSDDSCALRFPKNLADRQSAALTQRIYGRESARPRRRLSSLARKHCNATRAMSAGISLLLRSCRQCARRVACASHASFSRNSAEIFRRGLTRAKCPTFAKSEARLGEATASVGTFFFLFSRFGATRVLR